MSAEVGTLERRKAEDGMGKADGGLDFTLTTKHLTLTIRLGCQIFGTAGELNVTVCFGMLFLLIHTRDFTIRKCCPRSFATTENKAVFHLQIVLTARFYHWPHSLTQ